MTERIIIGKIIRPWGLRGEVLAAPETDVPERFFDLTEVWLGDEAEPRALDSVRMHGARLRLKLRGIESPEQAEPLRNEWIFIPAAQALPLDEGQYYVHDVLGLTVWANDGTRLGEVVEVMTGPANDVWVVEDDEAGEWLLPALDSVILAVDLADGRAVVAIPPGLERRAPRQTQDRDEEPGS